ncbi:MAG: hypothetical protein ABI175_14735 [Polyangiales bacterium]
MAHDTRSSPPVALRVVRPFATEGELLDAEASAFTRTGVVLIGAASRPNGVVLRFELTLRDGTAIMRGEGRVVGYRPPAANDEGALMLRFTRLDVKSKSLLDRAVSIREERRSLVPPGAPRPSGTSQSSMPAAPPAPSATTPPSVPSRPPGTPRPASAMPPRTSPHPAAAFGGGPPRPGIPSVAPTVQASPSPPPSELMASVDVDVDDDDEGTGEVDVSEVEEVDEVEEVAAVSLDEGDLTVQAPPVEMIASGPAPRVPPEHMPAPTPSPAHEPPSQPIAPEPPAPPVRSPEHAPAPQRSPERAPPPQRSPEPVRKLDSNVREGALERLRSRAKKLTELGSFFEVGERSSGPNQAPVTSAPHESMTPVLGSYVTAERDEKR